MIEVDKKRCLRCGGCVGTCPAGALTLTEHGIECDRDRCTSCKTCVNFCPFKALRVKA